MKLQILILVCTIRLSASVGDEDKRSVFSNMKTASDGITSVQAKMKQVKKSAFIEKAITSKADFYFMKPGKYALHPSSDSENEYVVNGDQVWIINRKNKTVTTTSQAEFNLEQYVIGMGSALETVEKFFSVKVDSKQSQKKFGSYKITLTPLKSSKFYDKLEVITLYIRDDIWLPYYAELAEDDGDSTTWEFTDFKINQKIKDDIFKQEIPKGFQIKKLSK